jgi:hypothetical protein
VQECDLRARAPARGIYGDDSLLIHVAPEAEKTERAEAGPNLKEQKTSLLLMWHINSDSKQQLKYQHGVPMIVDRSNTHGK